MEMKLTLDAATEPWGVLVERVEVKDVRVPERLQKAMAAEAEAAREARAKVGPCHHYPEKTTFASVSTSIRVPGDRG